MQKKRISNLKDKPFDVTESEKQKGKRMRKEWRKPTRLKEQEKKQNRTKLTSCTVGISEGGKGEKSINDWKLPKLGKRNGHPNKKVPFKTPKEFEPRQGCAEKHYNWIIKSTNKERIFKATRD